MQKEDPSGIGRQKLESALTAFSGEIQQAPPMYSAAKYQGKPLYQLARAGIIIERKTRPVQIHKLDIIDWHPPLVTIEVVCGKGTYIRSLAHDLGQGLGCGAYLKNLVRLGCGIFKIKDAISLDRLEEAAVNGDWQPLIYPVDSVLRHWAEVTVSEEDGYKILNGRPVVLSDFAANEVVDVSISSIPSRSFSEARCRAYALDGRFLGVLRFNTEREHWQPEKVFH
jgi:tRNA pseudouridine55 synthase